jgi:hypothetical protein
MRFAGRVFRVGRFWVIEVPILGVVTQGRTKREALEMIADAVEALVNRQGFHVDVYPGGGEYVEVGSADVASMTALLLRRLRLKRGLTLADVARNLGARSLNTYARYEQGRSIPSIAKLGHLLSAVSEGSEFVLAEGVGRRVA